MVANALGCIWAVAEGGNRKVLLTLIAGVVQWPSLPDVRQTTLWILSFRGAATGPSALVWLMATGVVQMNHCSYVPPPFLGLYTVRLRDEVLLMLQVIPQSILRN